MSNMSINDEEEPSILAAIFPSSNDTHEDSKEDLESQDLVIPVCDGSTDVINDEIIIEDVKQEITTSTDQLDAQQLSIQNYDILHNLEPRSKHELLEYHIQGDGTVICKMCGELLASRTHWYRHKYKIHVPAANTTQPSSLFHCNQCNAYFKSRKGYIGHVSSRHSQQSVTFQSQSIPINQQQTVVVIKNEPIVNDLENSCLKTETKMIHKYSVDSETIVDCEEKRRQKEEKLVAEIIDRVKRECEAQGSTVTRKGYNRRSTSLVNV